MALTIPASIEYKYLFSYLVYLIELTVPMYLLFTELEIKREYAFMAVLLYVSFFFIPFIVVSGVPSFYALGPFYCHQAAAMNLTTVALFRCGRSTFRISLVWGLVFIVCLFTAFASGPISNLIFVPVYALLWATVFFSNQADRRAIPFRLGLILFAFVLFSIVGLPSYIFYSGRIGARQHRSAFFACRDGLAHGRLLDQFNLALYDLLR
jgi:hypothetical protein